MSYEELESFIQAQNAKLAKSNRFLCATVYNAYQYMVVVVKTSMNLNQDIISAHCSFKIVETIGDCEFPSSGTIYFVYMGPIIAIGAVLIVTIIVLCMLVLQTEDWQCFFFENKPELCFRNYALTVTCRLHKLSN